MRYLKKSIKSNTREYSTLGNNFMKNEFGERRPPRSGGWQESRRRSRVKTCVGANAKTTSIPHSECRIPENFHSAFANGPYLVPQY